MVARGYFSWEDISHVTEHENPGPTRAGPGDRTGLFRSDEQAHVLVRRPTGQARLVGQGSSNHRRARLAQRHDNHLRQAIAATRPEVRRRLQVERAPVEGLAAAPSG